MCNVLHHFFLARPEVKVGFSQKELMRLSFLQTNYFPELKFLIFFSFLMAQIMSDKDMKVFQMLKKGVAAASNSYLT